ncbi:DUF308 domain-containing protein [Limibacter armeniacum]|uniref:HdeD family acid-resistance protein n=1 Tax=Limibacter armeniacum TaxID=466084 RepID=UPI002FE59146
MPNPFFKAVRKTVKYWYVPLIVGIIFIAAGIWTFTSQLEAYLALALIFSLSFIFSGVSEIVFSIANRTHLENWGWMLCFGIFTLIIGLLLLLNPEISMTTLPFYVGFVVLFRSIGAVSTALDLKNYGVLDWGNLLGVGILGIIFSFILLWNPLFAGLTIVFWTALALTVTGCFSIYFSFKLKKLHDLPNKVPEDLKHEYEDLQMRIQQRMHGHGHHPS